jgi:hypothetical protein
MKRSSVEAIVRAFEESNVRYLIVGGLAVVAHGHLRFTADIDVVLDLSPENLQRALPALADLGYRPRPPVPLEAFEDPAERRRWVDQKGLTVFSLWSPRHRESELDLFVTMPFDFDAAHERRLVAELAPGLLASFVSLEDLIRMKEEAGRPQDLEDIRRIRELGDEAVEDG